MKPVENDFILSHNNYLLNNKLKITIYILQVHGIPLTITN